MFITELGMVILFRSEQSVNAPSPMLVMPLGMSIFFRPLQYEKAYLPMLVTLPSFGITLLLHPATSFFVFVSIMQFPEE